MKIYDISQEVYHCQVFPGDPAPRKDVLLRIADGAACNLSVLTMCAHNGTHVDAPYHFINDGKTIDQVGLDVWIGPCFVACAEGNITSEMAQHIIEKAKAANQDAARRLLIKGKAIVTEAAAKVFAEQDVLLVGSESQTVGPEDAPAAVHRILLGAGTVLLEGIRLGDAEEGIYLLNAAPLNLGGSDGAPCRAVLIDLN